MKLDIPRRANVCSLGNEILAVGEVYISVLKDGLQFLRLDYCADCWEKIAKTNSSIFWKSKVPPKISAKPKIADLSDYALTLLKKALNAPGLEAEEEAFILALYLARKRKLLLRSKIAKENDKYFLYEAAQTEELFTIKKLNLTALQAAKVQDSLAKKFSNPCDA